ncbi:hypothetical protein Acr_14g0001080 [Actinidia rufa]|uniref:Uncharacterized protein n=1 Tax=Actinidia rufa TaxID=165716 RepID=A0A7J0FP27_9ERIC|nr:hypothetical protein Acr_14g0001080 [Actinidia rufa]
MKTSASIFHDTFAAPSLLTLFDTPCFHSRLSDHLRSAALSLLHPSLPKCVTLRHVGSSSLVVARPPERSWKRMVVEKLGLAGGDGMDVGVGLQALPYVNLVGLKEAHFNTGINHCISQQRSISRRDTSQAHLILISTTTWSGTTQAS